jgi:hypothetical protein
MEVLLVLLVLIGLGTLVLGVAFYVRLWSTLGVHRRAMETLYLHLSEQRAFPPEPLGHVPPQSSPHTRWNTQGDQS